MRPGTGRAAVLLALAFAIRMPATAGDDDDRRWRSSWNSDRVPVGRGFDPVSVTLRDLQYLWSMSRVDGHEARHFRRAMDALVDFQERSARGRFDRRRLDRAIDNMENLSQSRQLHPGARALIAKRLVDLRRFRSGGQASPFERW